ncbi:hypothetical protein [Streptomyces violaceus]|uniref:Integral membrane protein n=1 Tax=Streptomyces violaceus TaxID=1936 RepID=A0ABY9U9P7_STRVL|nr:hypothetical protein [Streptomyces janthinus]WND18971.1 hypothetical protein RI060_17180 [Streptomyces janthinus]GGS88873.1 membrane protein [Streptomyces janthinus]
MQREADDTGANRRIEARDGLGIAGVILCLVVGTGVILLFTGVWKRFARETLPALVDFPGGYWAVGGVLGVITVLGAIGGLRCASGASDRTWLARGLGTAGTAVYCAAAFGPLFYLLSGLPGKNCRSESCAYIPGIGSAFLAYALSTGVVGWLLHRWISARAEERASQERERLRRLRQKGKGKSRAVRGR